MRARTSRGTALVLAAALAAGCGGQEGKDSQALDSAAAEQSFARGGSASGQAQRNLCSGSPETIAGVVVGVGGGAGLTIDSGSGAETVYGLGPTWYWSQSGVDRPAVGDAVTVVASHVITMEDEAILNITVDGQAIALRDPSTCTPLW